MTEILKPENANLIDDELAHFADRILANEEPEMIKMSGQKQELLALEAMATRMDRAFKASEPAKAASSRIRANLVREWQRSGPQAGKPSFWARWLWMPSVTQPQWAGIAAAAAALVLVVFAFPILLSSVTEPLSGAAGNGGQVIIDPAKFVVVGLGVIALAGIVWFVRRRKR